jgi:molecular chaperone DnaK
LKQGQSAVLAPKKEEYYPKVQSEPKLGGEGSGFPPCYYVATGQHNHIVLGIDIGSESIRVSALEEDEVSNVVGPRPAALGLNHFGDWFLSNPAEAALSKHGGQYRGIVQELRTKLGTDWCKDFAGQTFGAEELTSKLMHQIVGLAKARSQKSLRDVVLTVPASYTSLERKLLKVIAEDNGLSVIQLINEPTAAALAYYCVNPEQEEGHYMIFHMGAGTCAATVFSLSNRIMEIKATSADSTLGGRSFDDIVVDYLINLFEEKTGKKPRLDEETLQRFEQAAVTIKHSFVMASESHFNISNLYLEGPEIGYGNLCPRSKDNFTGSVSRKQFDDLVQPIVERAVGHVHKALRDSHILPGDISKMLICGGATLLPTMRSALSEISPTGAIERLEDNMMPACGAAVQACLVCQKVNDLVVWDLLTKPVSIVIADGTTMPLIAANTPLPVTAYAKLEIVDNTINARLVQGGDDDCKTYTDIVINNCPPCTNGEHKVELAVRVSQDGIINYGARHIGLDVALLVSPLQDERRRYQGDLERLLSSQAKDVAGARAKKLARTLNVPLYFLPQALRAMGFTPEQIVSGQAIELALRKIKMERKKKGNRD